MKDLSLLFLLTCTSIIYGQSVLNSIENEIKNLNTQDKIQDYWINIFTEDQNNNGADLIVHDEKTDVINLYKVACLITEYGYPTADKYQYPASVVPWVVWTHCNYPMIKKYTIPLILMGKNLNQLPEGMYPNYFVGSLLLDSYGLDMEYDPDFSSTQPPTLETALKCFESIKSINMGKLKKMVKKQINYSSLLSKKTLGQWNIKQQGVDRCFEINLLEDNQWCLISSKNNEPETIRFLHANKDLNIFEPEASFGLFYFFIDNLNELHIRDRGGNTIKKSE